MQSSIPEKAQATRKDQFALWGGIAFSLLFTALIWWAGRFLDRSMLLPDQGASWYFWKLPNPTFWTRATAWGFYLLHQFTIWGIIYYAQRQNVRTISGLHKFNLMALAANAFFITLHFAQTHLFYDGLAQDVSIWSSQVSVIILLVWVLLMENSRRGLFFGKKVPIGKRIIEFARKYHGYYFAWATIYTFWYHPMENSFGHLAGFFYMFLLLLQGSLFFTRVHVNRYWTFVMEFAVLIHGTLVAVFQGNGIWPMFLFGFAGMFIITQMHGLRLPKWALWLMYAVYLGGVVLVYSGRGFNKLYELISIPLIEYLSVFLLTAIFAGILWVIRRFQTKKELSVG
ncbi:MAG: hypothetical protein HGA53_06500 [Anaerolineaceae bacterium]|nr:hypothetical protein [Anaerolineaceae bacterium]